MCFEKRTHDLTSRKLQDWQRADIATKKCPADQIDAVSSEGHAERQQSLLASHSFGSGAVELSPLEDPSCCLDGKLDEASGVKTRYANAAVTGVCDCISHPVAHILHPVYLIMSDLCAGLHRW